MSFATVTLTSGPRQGGSTLDSFWQDARHSLRVLRRSPGFTLASILTLGLGIAANTTIFGFMSALLLRPFPLLDLDRLVSIWETHPQEGPPGGPRGGDRNPLAVADYLDLEKESPGIEGLAGYRYRDLVLTETGEPERIPAFLVTRRFFETIGVTPALGRTFLPEEGVPGRDEAVLLSHAFWTRRFGADPTVLGRALVLEGRRRNVVGVLPRELNFPPGAPDVFLPLAFSDDERYERGRLTVLALARLSDDGAGSAQAAIDALSARLARLHPETNEARSHLIVPLRETDTGFVTPFFLLFEAGAAFVLLIACANVAGLLVARSASREKEMALRAALGAGRGRIVRQLLTEGLVLSTLGAAAALWISDAAFKLLRASLPRDLVRWVAGFSEIRTDGRTLAFTLGLALATTIVFALIPALGAARSDLVEALKAGGRGSSGPPRRRLRGALVAFQVTTAVVLMAGAALMTRGFVSLVNLYQGFNPEKVVTFRLALPGWQYPEMSGVAGFYERVLRDVGSMPGIEVAGVVSQPPADLGPIPRSSFAIEGRPLARPQEKRTADVQTISGGYLDALDIGVRRGRGFLEGDTAGAPPVALVSESLAERFWPGEDVIGKRIRVGAEEPWRIVVGVVGEVKQYWFDREPRPTLYVPYLQSPRRDMFLIVRSSLDTASVVGAVRSGVREADRDQPIDEIRTMATVVEESASFIRLAAALMMILAAVALVLAGVGLYGVMAEHVARRTQEIGIRMALGARGADIFRLVVGRVARLILIGLAAGLVGALVLGRLMAGSLFGVVQFHFPSLAAVMAVLALVALGAAFVPVRRATRIDPLSALREE